MAGLKGGIITGGFVSAFGAGGISVGKVGADETTGGHLKLFWGTIAGNKKSGSNSGAGGVYVEPC